MGDDLSFRSHSRQKPSDSRPLLLKSGAEQVQAKQFRVDRSFLVPFYGQLIGFFSGYFFTLLMFLFILLILLYLGQFPSSVQSSAMQSS